MASEVASHPPRKLPNAATEAAAAPAPPPTGAHPMRSRSHSTKFSARRIYESRTSSDDSPGAFARANSHDAGRYSIQITIAPSACCSYTLEHAIVPKIVERKFQRAGGQNLELSPANSEIKCKDENNIIRAATITTPLHIHILLRI